MTLNEVAPGQTVFIKKLTAIEDELRERLEELGFLEGVSVQMVQEAPFGKDPIMIKVRGTLLGLRRAEAKCVEVSV